MPIVSTNFLKAVGRDGPVSPDDVAARGTYEWRQAFAKNQDYLKSQLAQRGAFDPGSARKTLMDLGMRPEKEKGLANFSRLGELTTDAKNLQDEAARRYQMGWGGGRDTATGQRYGYIGGNGPGNGGGQGQGNQGGGLSSMNSGGGWAGASYRNNPSANPNITFNDALGIMNYNRSNAAGIQSGVQDTWGAVLGMKFNPQTGTYEKMDSAAADGMLAPMIQGIMKNAEGLKQQVMNTVPPGGQRDKALAQISEQVQAQIAQQRQALQGQALGALSDIFMKDKYWTDPLAQEGMQLSTQRKLTADQLANALQIAQMQDATQRYGIGEQTGLGWGQLELGQDNLSWDMDRFQREMDFNNLKFNGGLNQDERDYNYGAWQGQNPSQFFSANY